jgi:hypothetical protein
MPYCWQVGRTAASMARAKIEYGGCSQRNRTWPRACATHCASTICSAGKVDEPTARTLPLRTRSERADRVSSMSVSGSGRCIWYRSM